MGHEMTSEMVETVRRANALLRPLSRREQSDGYKIVGGKIWAALTATGIMSGIITDPVQVNELLAILRG